MKLMHFAVLLGLLAFIGCEETGVEEDMPATMPGQYDSDVGDGLDDAYDADMDTDTEMRPGAELDTENDPLTGEQPPLGEGATFGEGTTLEEESPESTPDTSGSTPPTIDQGTTTTPPGEGDDDPDVVKEVEGGNQP